MKTVFAKPATVRGDWFVVDASGKTLGRLASEIAHRLKGKHKADYSPHVDMGDHIVVLNAEKIHVTGNKLNDKIYYHHTGYLGNLKSIALGKLLQSTRSARSSSRSRACCRRTRSAGACSRSCTCSRATSTRTPPSSPSRSTSKHPIPGNDSMPATSNYGTGRRKTSTARVYLKPGTGTHHGQRAHAR